jgi:hypothetical protein
MRAALAARLVAMWRAVLIIALMALLGAVWTEISGEVRAADADVRRTAAYESGVDRRQEIVFVDGAVPDRKTLQRALDPGDPTRSREVIVLDPASDGVAQITRALAKRAGISAVHIVSHGEDGSVELGSVLLDQRTLRERAPLIAGWGNALASGGDLLIYGCNVAAGASGRTLLNTLSIVTGADVAASTNFTGQSGLGGDWTLEYTTGRIETSPVIRAALERSWTGLLAITSVNATQDTYIKGKSGETGLNFGAATSLVVDRESTDLQRALLRFDLSSIPGGSTINSATLRMQATQIGGTLNINVYELLQSWNEGTGNGTAGEANWINRAPSTAWTTAGGTFNPTAVATLNTNSTGQHSWNVTALVQAWIAGSGTNNGLMVASPDGGGNRTATYDSREGATVPFLEIDYTPPVLTISGTVFEDVNYGGGAGRNRATALGNGGSARPAVRVELFNASTGAFITSVLTNSPNGDYSFIGVAAGSYTVRVVSTSVTSSRTVAALRPVMTFRTNASSGTAVGVTDYVGGHDPATQDAANAAAGWVLNAATGIFSGSGSGTAHAFAPVTVTAANVTGVDFGWNFDTVSNTNSTGQGSLFAAITSANTLTGDAALAQSGRPAGIENTIFMISNGTSAAGLRAANNYFVSGIATISPTAASLLTISAPLVLDAQMQPGWTTTPIVELNGTSAGALQNGLTVSGGGTIIRGFVVNRFANHGIYLITAGGNAVQGNYIGTNAAGTAASANGLHGIFANNIANNLIGGTTTAARNVISGNGGSGVYILGAAATGNSVQGNYIGTNAAGTSAVANGFTGVWVEAAPNNTIGGTAAGAGNVVSGNTNHGVYLYSSTSGTLVQGNYIGTSASGTAAIPNQVHGVTISAGASNNTIGGTTIAARNVISGNQIAGVRLATTTTSDNTIAGNYIGVDVSGTAALGNGTYGVFLEATNTTIGGATAASSNVIANNGADGIAVVNISLGNGILRNAIYSNAGLGIDLADDGVTTNNGAKSASLPNSGMDFPVFTTAVLVGTTLTVTGYVGSAPGNPTFANALIEIFKSDNDASGNGEGQSYLGPLTADASGNFSGSLTVSGLSIGERITATATDGINNTSEFGANFSVTVPPGGISGRVFEDANFAGAASDYDGGASDLGLANVDVELYDGTSNAYLGSTTTAADGTYSFTGLVIGSYKVRVRAATIGDADTPPKGTLNATVPATWPYPLAEMTWGNGSARYGGQLVTVDDTATGDNAGPGDDFMTVAVSGAAVANVNFGFAFNLIVNTLEDSNANTARSTQGGLRQFIKNANAIGTAGGTTANTSQFRMQVATNQSSGGNAWWRIATPITLPPIADGGTVLNGLTQTANGGDSNTLGPEIEIVGNAAMNGINLTSANNVVRGIAAHGYDGNSDFGAVAINGAAATGNTVAGNYLGTNATGTASDTPTTYQGVAINAASGNIVGGLTVADRNVLSGNRWNGMKIEYAGATGNTVIGNYVGTNALGTAAVPNQLGIFIWDVPSNVIGGTTAAETNVVSGNMQVGVYVFGANSTGNVIQGNTIGLNAARSAALPNVTRGVQFASSSGNLLGGTVAGAGNIIASNGNVGVVVNGTTPSGNAILSNSIYANTGLGIDLGANGVTINDGAKTAAQPNLYMDTPVFTSAALLGTTLTVAGYVGSAPGQPLFAGARVEIFKSDGDTSGSGEGQVFLGFLTTDLNGNFSGSLTVSGLAVGDQITGTATDGSNNTSEFGQNVSLGVPAITVTKFSAVLSDPVNDTTNPKRIPGAVIEYSITTTNTGNASPDAGTVIATDPIDSTALAFRVSTGVTFTDGATGSGLSLGAVTYSSTPAPGPYVYSYTPVPDADGYDGNITSVRAATTGSFAFGGAPPPSFTLKFQVKIK